LGNKHGIQLVDTDKRRLFRRKYVKPGNLPWLSEPQVFSQQCTRCGECASECETNIITKGDGGFPVVDFYQGECTFCYKCAKSCPEKLFSPQSTKPWEQIATISNQCLAKQGVDCRVCEESCEPFAIQFKPQLGSVAQPTIEPDACNGCGGCVASCPTKAITVNTIDIQNV
jgi:ferredoxin-type protein NapF